MRFPFNGIAASLLALGLAACGNSAEQNSTSAPAASQPIAASQPAATGVSEPLAQLASEIRSAEEHEHRPGQSIHQFGLHRRA